MIYTVNGCDGLKGEISVCSAKNCVLALLAASVLSEEDVVIRRCERIADVENMIAILEAMGCTVLRSSCGDVTLNCGALNSSSIPQRYAGRLRGSVFLLGALIGRTRKATAVFPGGCAIGERPIDIHLSGFEKMGVKVKCEEGQIYCDAGNLHGAEIVLRFASVGATENLVMAAVLAPGVTVLKNCAVEPEVEALERFLCSMGADISGAGTPTVVIRGVKKLHGTVFTPIPDRIVAATYLAACACTGGDVTVTDCDVRHLESFLDILKPRFRVDLYRGAVRLRAEKKPRGYGYIVTAPYPGFPTDMQSLTMSMAAVSDGGETVIKETLFENRLTHNASELNRMGAVAQVEADTVYIRGARRLCGTDVRAADLRGGAGLVIAGLASDGVTCVHNAEQIVRGYASLDCDLRLLGANVYRTD